MKSWRGKNEFGCYLIMGQLWVPQLIPNPTVWDLVGNN